MVPVIITGATLLQLNCFAALPKLEEKVSAIDNQMEPNQNPYRFQGSILAPEVRGRLDRIIKESKFKEVVFKDYPRRDNWDVEILPRANPESLGITPNEADEKRGFIAFSRPITELVFPYSKPQERRSAFSVVASRGEYEPFTLCLFNLGRTQNYTVSLSPFKQVETGEQLGSVNTEIRTPVALPLIRKEQGIYLDLPMALERRNTRSIAKGETGQFWITTHVPEGAKPGKYEAVLTVSNGGNQRTEFPVRLTVLPFILDEPKADLSMCFLIQDYKEMHPENLDLYMGDMKTHGLNTCWMWPLGEIEFKGQGATYDFQKKSSAKFTGLNYFAHSVEETLKAYQKAGFKRNWIYGSCDGLMSLLTEKGKANIEDPVTALPFIKDYVQQLRLFCSAHQLPAFDLLLTDEPGFQKLRLPSVKKLYEEMHKALPDQPLMVDCGPWENEDRLLAPYLKTIYFTEPSASRKAFCEDNNIRFGNYNAGSGGKNPLVDRFCYGFWPVKAKLKGVSNWVYTWLFDPRGPDGNLYVYPAEDGPVPTIAWEAVRKGINDQRYLQTFFRVAEDAIQSGDQKRRERALELKRQAGDFLNEIPENRSDRSAYLDSLSHARFDAFRDFLISGISELLNPSETEGRKTANQQSHPNVHDGTLTFSATVNQGLAKPAVGMSESEGFRYSLDLRFDEIPGEGAFFGGVGYDWFAALSPQGYLEFGFLKEDVKLLQSSLRLTAGRWYALCFTVASNKATICVDGEQVATANLSRRQWRWNEPIRLSGFPWESPVAKGYYGRHGFFVGQLRNISLAGG